MSKNRQLNRRRGATLILVLFLLVIILGMAAFAFDLSRMQLVRSQLQTSVDAGAIAGALQLKKTPNDLVAAKQEAEKFVQRQRVGFQGTVLSSAITVDTGNWDRAARTFQVSGDKPNAIRVLATHDKEAFFFASIFGRSEFSIPSRSIAVAGPSKVDIMMALDLSSSMGSSGRIEALQSAAPIFVNVIKALKHDDQVGVLTYGVEKNNYDGQVYTASPESLFPAGSNYATDWVGVLEQVLTKNMDTVINGALSPSELTADKYGGGTPIGAAIRDAAHYLNNNGRSGVVKRIVLLSDGEANQPTSDPSGYALQMAIYAHSLGIKTYTISLGADADVSLMSSIASATGGIHFDARGTTANLKVELANAFVASANEIKKTTLVN